MRYRPSAGRLLIEIFYGTEFIRRDSMVHINISKMARKLHVRPVRLCETLEWLARYGMINDLSLYRKEASFNIIAPRGFCEDNEKGQ
jgi:hypothetical protein